MVEHAISDIKDDGVALIVVWDFIDSCNVNTPKNLFGNDTP